MTFADLFKSKYKAQAWCNNCKTHQEINVPKGVTLTQFLEGNTGKCNNCGCNTLVNDYPQIKEFDRRPRQAPLPAPRPSNRPRGNLPQPKPEVPEDDTIFKNDIKDLDWIGKPQRRTRYENY